MGICSLREALALFHGVRRWLGGGGANLRGSLPLDDSCAYRLTFNTIRVQEQVARNPCDPKDQLKI